MSKKKFDKAAGKQKARMITIPAHTVKGFDGLSCYEDGMAGKLTNVCNSYIESQYSYTANVPEQKYAFTSWKDVPVNMAPETRSALQSALEADDRRLAQQGNASQKPAQFKAAR